MKTHRPPNGLDVMISRACGLADDRKPVRIMLVLRCPKCKRRDRLPAEDCYPEHTAAVEVTCPKCNGGDLGDDLVFLDANGKVLA